MSDRADLEPCERACCCRECEPELSDAERRRKRVVTALACGCLVCTDHLTGKH